MTVENELFFVRVAMDYAVEARKAQGVKTDIQSEEAFALALGVLKKVYRDIMPTVTVKEG
jgi:hypothetical protein